MSEPSRVRRPFTERDLAQLAAHGIGAAEAERHLELAAAPPAPIRLLRACRVGDGIFRLDEEAQRRAVARAEDAARQGRLSKFVPASGAATRMFADPMEALAELVGPSPLSDRERIVAEAGRGRDSAQRILELFAGLDRLPFYDQLAGAAAAAGFELDRLVDDGRWATVLRLLLGPSPVTASGGDAATERHGLGYEELPKGLIPFHQHPDGPRTPFDEHLIEAAALVADADGRAALHFTVGADQRERIERQLVDRGRELGAERGVTFDLSFSIQSPSTDTLAADPAGGPFRLADGSLHFRPGGHGSLIGNLEATRGDLVLVKNIDNVSPEERSALERHWKKVLAGLLVSLRDEIDGHLAALAGETDHRREEAVAGALALARRWLAFEPPSGAGADELAGALERRLDRPLRVCGMVENRGEPGGGPFWTDGAFGPAPQIVERAQIDVDDPGQADILASSTHFNPVDMACALRDRHGRPYELDRFIDRGTAFVSHKRAEGRELLALERPGLWNGAMAGWNTVFVEVPAETFTPVKTVLDLLRPEHETSGPG